MGVAPMPQTHRHSSGWSIFLSVLMIVGGVLAIFLPLAAGIAVSLVVGWVLIFAGAAHLVYAWHAKGFGGVVWQVVLGLLYLAVAIVLLVNPVSALASMTLLFAAYLLVESILEFVLAYELRHGRNWGWLLFDGIVTLVLAVLIWASWPWSSAWAIGMLVGISILVAGIARLALTAARAAS